LPLVLGDLERGAGDGNAGAVDDDLHRAQGLFGCGKGGGHRAGVAHVECHHAGLASHLAQFGEQGLAFADAAAGQCQLATGASQGEGELPAQAAKCAGHERDLAIEVGKRVGVWGQMHCGVSFDWGGARPGLDQPTALSSSSMTFLASPNTIIVLSM
jgi:hypothetical protein